MRTFLVLWFWLLASSAWAAPWDEPFGPPDAILAAAEAEAPADQGLAVLLDEVSYEVDEQRRVHQTWRLVYRGQTTESVDSAGRVEAWWTPWYQERPEVRVRVLHPDGSSDELDPSSLIEVRPGSGGSDVYSERLGLEGPLPRIEVGAVIERRITVRAHSPFFSAGEVHEYDLRWSDVPRARVVEIRAAKGVPLLVKAVGFEGKSKRKKAKGQQIHRFELGPMTAMVPESMVPRDAQPGPEIRFTTGRSWAEVASTYAAHVDAQLAGSDLKELALEAAGGATEPREQVANVFDWVRTGVRYTGLEFGENALIPVSPTETLERGFGDCKDQSALLVGLLRALGLDAHIALLKASDWFDVDPELPGLRDFDHAIAYVDQLDLWLDPTDRSALVGELRPATEDRLALIARPDTKELTRTTRRGAKDNVLRLEWDFFLAPEGRSRLVVRQRASGAIGQEYRDGWSGTSDKDAREWLSGLTEDKWGSNQLG